MNLLILALEDHRGALHRLMAARAGSAEADDLMQELYLKVAGVERPQEIRDAPGFVFRLAFNLASSWRRGTARRVRRDDAWMREETDLVGGTALVQAPWPDEALAGRQELARILAALRRLSPRTQEVFELHKLQGLSYAEVAARLGVSRSAVEKHMMKALAALSAVRSP